MLIVLNCICETAADMSADSKLYSAEDSLKDKYSGILNRMSHVELKQFKKYEYKLIVLDEIKELLPAESQSRLDQTALCVSNFLQNEVQKLLRRKPRKSTEHSTQLLSETILNDLDITLQSNENKADIDHDSSDDDSELNEAEDTTCLDDSVTLLKEAARSEPIHADSSDASKTESKRPTKSTKCCDTCKVKPTSKRNYDQIRCSLCAQWFHEACVGIIEDEPVGIWLCHTCREIPTSLKQNVNSMKLELNDLKVCTESLLKSVQDLFAKVDNSFEGINDRITALTKHINGKDLCISESIEQLQVSTKTLKTSLDQKSCQILNKTTAVLDKIKTKTDDSMKVTEEPKISNNTINKTETTNANQSASQKKQFKKPQGKTQQKLLNSTYTKRSAHSSIVLKQVQPQRSQPTLNTDDETDHIDLTESARKPIKQPTLLIGSSILKQVQTNELNGHTTVRSFPGATITTLNDKIKKYNIDECKTIILHVGGNDADQGVDIDSFCDNYIALLESLASDNRRIIVSGLLPRKTANLEPYNEQLRSLCDIEFVDHFDSFLLATGEIPANYFWKDKVHLNQQGKQKLLSNINNVCKITNVQKPLRPKRLFQGSQQGARPPYHKGPRSMSRFCHICKTNSHSTEMCWYNGRNTGMPGRFPQ